MDLAIVEWWVRRFGDAEVDLSEWFAARQTSGYVPSRIVTRVR